MVLRRIVCVGTGLVVAVAAYACRTPTEMTVRVTTNVPCKTLKGVAISVAPSSADAETRAATKFYAAQTQQCQSDTEVGTLVVTPGESSFSVIVVAGVDSDVTACTPPLYAGCIVARRRLAFVEHRSLDVPIELTRDCLDVPCDTETSCVHGGCKPVDTTCNDTSCMQAGASPDGDGGGVDDGGELDGRADASGDAGSIDGTAPDAMMDAGIIDSGTGDAPFTKEWHCFASPACPPPPGVAAPCMCNGPVMVDGGAGAMSVETMIVDCPFNAPRCNCLIEGQIANTIPSMSFCNQSQFGACCAH